MPGVVFYSVPINTLNRQCSSGLTAIAQIANEIKAGEIDIGIGTSLVVLSLPPAALAGNTSRILISHFFHLVFCCTGAGVESMSLHYGAGVLPSKMSSSVLSNKEASDCLLPMGITSENVAEQYNVGRKMQDEFAAKSYEKAGKAQREGRFREEIVPVKVSGGFARSGA